MARDTFPTVGANNLASQRELRNFIIHNQTGVLKGARTTLSMTGGRQYNVTAQSLSDVMQGTMAVRGPEEMQLVINKALSNDLDYIYASDYANVSAFSTAKYAFNAGDGDDDNADDGTAGNGMISTWEGDATTALEPKYVAQIGFQAGIPEGGAVPLWKMVAVAGRESTFRPMAENSNGEDKGLWQINMSAHASTLHTEGILVGTTREEWRVELLDPVTNGFAAHQIIYGRGSDPNGNFEQAWGAGVRDDGSFGWVGEGGDPLWHTNQQQAKDAVATAKAEGLLGKPFMPPANSTGGGSTGSSTPGNHTIAQIKKASAKVGAHPNNKLNASALSEAGQTPQSGGLPNSAISYCVYAENGKAWLMPSVLNHLWFIFENGFQLGSNWGVIVAKYSGSGNGKPSNHAYGGAVDIGTVGLASDGVGYDAHTPAYRPIFDKMMNLLSTTPKDGWADEYGCHFGRVEYGGAGFHTYMDEGHFHLGFKPARSGTLISALL